MNQDLNAILQQYAQQSAHAANQAVVVGTGSLVLMLLLFAAYVAAIIYTLNHCLCYCHTEEKTPYTLAILLCPIAGIIFYWKHAPFEQPSKVETTSPTHRKPGFPKELMKPQTTAPFEPARPDQQAAPQLAPTASKGNPPPPGFFQPLPKPAKPIHIIAEERKATNPPFTTA